MLKVLKGKEKKKKICNQVYPTQQASHLDSTKKSRALQMSKVKRIRYHQSSFSTIAKGISLDKKHKRKQRPTITNCKQVNGKGITYINNYFKCKWVKCSNQMTQIG